MITEFGGGYGSMCRVALNNLGLSDIKWEIIDLPIMLELQKAYLKESLSTKKFNQVGFHESTSKIFPVNNSLFIATWSLSERQ